MKVSKLVGAIFICVSFSVFANGYHGSVTTGHVTSKLTNSSFTGAYSSVNDNGSAHSQMRTNSHGRISANVLPSPTGLGANTNIHTYNVVRGFNRSSGGGTGSVIGGAFTTGKVRLSARRVGYGSKIKIKLTGRTANESFTASGRNQQGSASSSSNTRNGASGNVRYNYLGHSSQLMSNGYSVTDNNANNGFAAGGAETTEKAVVKVHKHYRNFQWGRPYTQ